MHIGIIPDGNRRWAKRNGLTLHESYSIGFRNGIEVALHLSRLGFRHLTFYGLTHNNYRYRPADQVESILSQIVDAMTLEVPLLVDHGIRVRFYGEIAQLRVKHRKGLGDIEKQTGLVEDLAAELHVLVNYSPEWDLRTGSSEFATRNIPPCDLIFRSGRSKRLSGFLPMQSANAELHFSSKLWPDVTPDDVLRAVARFSKMGRQFGA